ncbi:L-2-amino-thiazoline-4-carboxylic acid hydrolase [Butyrivibrio sp. LB2008]|uniref:L-2-amino-thiazoline-4-carboxylic acid hydrolase n=1 Tax=Butyrivibrio sp. LB2008 TaxID=1408305 RepID=UPI000685569B|nr:L-2-amino-thiazoline-4-carboxylic acid hydrolase [Butyrivibrio sp. LB2008]
MMTVEKAMKGMDFIKSEVYKEFAQSDADEIWKNATDKLEKIMTEHSNLPKGVAAHTDRVIFPAAALYLSMKEKDADKAFEVIRVAMKNKSEQSGASLARAAKFPGFTRFFLAMWGPVARKSFGEASGFKNVFYPKKKGEFCMDITQCPYHTYLTELGCPEINKLFCDNDIYNYGNIPGLEFIRTKTIGNGDELCDFRLRLK